MTRAELEELRLLAEQDDDGSRIAALVVKLLDGSPAAIIRIEDPPHVIRLDGKLCAAEAHTTCKHRAPLNYDRTRHATCTLPAGHAGRHRQDDLAWTDRTMPCRAT